ncbi:MAG: T9SS type A sorting domain-containing protein [Bacteroidota bacterium]
MKQFFSFILLCFSASIAIAGGSTRDNKKDIPENMLSSNFTIDMYDTVVFDISQSVMNGNQVSFPVYIISDDTINALDFSLAYDETNFGLDTIFNLTTYLQPVYNFTMSRLYFTSYSLQEIDHNTPLVSVQLDMLGHYLCSDDLDSILVYLNGDACSVKVVECVTDKITETNSTDEQVSIYPNPATGILNIQTIENVNVELFDINASRTVYQSKTDPNRLLQINTDGFAQGIYLVKMYNENFTSIRKVAIN